MLLAAVCGFQNFVVAENLGVVNDKGSTIEIYPYIKDIDKFQKCIVADAKTQKYWNGEKYILPAATVAYFSINKSCEKDSNIMFSAGDNFFGYTFGQQDLAYRVSFKFINPQSFIYISQDIYHDDGTIIDIGSN